MAVRRVAAILLVSLSCGAGGASLEDEFRDPPHPAKPWVYWINMDGHFTKEGITADLESMKAVGIGGMIHMDVDVGLLDPAYLMQERMRALALEGIAGADLILYLHPAPRRAPPHS